MKPVFTFFGIIALVLAGCSDSGGGGGSGLKREVFADLYVDPRLIVFSPVPPGDAAPPRIVTLRNAGGGTLHIVGVDFSNGVDEREFEKTHDALPVTLEADEEMRIGVVYRPQDDRYGDDGGELIIKSNDGDEPTFRIPIRVSEANAELRIEPTELIFGPVVSGDSKALAVKLTNVGAVPVAVTGVTVSDDTSPDFAITENADARPTLNQGDAIAYGVTYAPIGLGTDDGTLVITTNDPGHPSILIPLRGDEPSPEIDVSPAAINFGAVDEGEQSDIEPLFILNSGSAPLIIERIYFAAAAPPTNEQFILHDVPADDAFPIRVEPDGELQIGVQYAPVETGHHRTAIAIESNDADEGLLTVPIEGRVRRPCISVNPERLDFGRVALGIESAHNALQIVNCGDLPLSIDEIVIDGAPGFEWAPAPGEDVNAELAPLTMLPIEVWYTNNDLAEGAVAEATLTVNNNTVDRPSVDVPLAVIGGGAPTCNLLILPNRVDFGLVSRGRNVSREVEVVNRGTGHCELRNQELVFVGLPIPGFNELRFVITRRIGDRRLPPGSFTPMELTYRPQTFTADRAQLVVTYWDPFLMEERTATADLVGVGGESNIEVIPGHLDFGRVTAGECASRTEHVTVYNTGVVHLCISDIRFDGEGCDEFFIVDRPVADENGCIVVTRNSPAEVQLVYEPGNIGSDECTLVFESDDPDNPEMRVPLAGEGTPDREQTDEFVQTSGQKVDVLFVVDNSGSMGEEQTNLEDNFGEFIHGADQFENDFQIGITTTDMQNEAHSGRLQGDPRLIRRDPQAEAQFGASVHVGTNGSGTELGLEAAHKALSDPLAFDTGVQCGGDGDCVAPDTCVEGTCGGYNRGLVRGDAALEVVFVSDEEDQSPATLNFYVDFLKNIKGFRNESRFHAHAVVGAVNGRAEACHSEDGDAGAGRRYAEVADRTGGHVHSICDDDFGVALREIGNTAFGLPVQFFLSRPAVRNSIRVTVDGAAREGGWDYDEESNSIIFDEAAVPQPGSHIQVTYEAQCFPRHN